MQNYSAQARHGLTAFFTRYTRRLPCPLPRRSFCLRQTKIWRVIPESPEKSTPKTMETKKTCMGLKSDKGLKEFNAYMEDKSYVNGYIPTHADVETFNAMTKAPPAHYINALRWYNHIKSFSSSERKKFSSCGTCPMKTAKPTTAPAVKNDDVDLFASDDSENAEAAKIRKERLKAYAKKKSKKPGPVAKSSVLLDVKPWDDKTDMKKMEVSVRTIEAKGIVWGASKLVPVGYGIHKLQIMCVVEDTVSVDGLIEKIEAFRTYVQSVDIAAFNKI